MRSILPQIAVVSCLVLGAGCGHARAAADDDKWIARCMKDNKGEGANESVVYRYCVCMINKMDKSKTRSITEWQKTHPEEMKACEIEAGWK